MSRMSRAPLGVFGVVVVVLIAAAEACSGPAGGDVTPNSPEAQATNVRRTAVAGVQRIIANPPTQTALPEPNATAKPSCDGAIWWTEARSHLGESRKVQGTIVGTRPAPDGSLLLLEIGQPYPDPTGLAVLVPAALANNLSGKSVCVAGRITNAQGSTTMQVRDASSIVVVK
jgi:hypothetical protein